MKYRSIQIVRAFAALIVVMLHTIDVSNDVRLTGLDLPGWLCSGYAGVDIFFVISGFIISLVIDRPVVKPGEFALKRCIRILPFYWLLTLIFTLMIKVGGKPVPGLGDLIASLLVLPTHSFPVLGVGWSLEQEFIFYTTVAVLLVARRKQLLVAALVALFMVGLFWHVLLRLEQWDFRLFSLYNFDFLLGVLIYRYRAKIARLDPYALVGTGAIVFIIAGAVVSYLYGGGHVPTSPEGFRGLARVLLFGAAAALIISGMVAAETSEELFRTRRRGQND